MLAVIYVGWKAAGFWGALAGLMFLAWHEDHKGGPRDA